MSTLFSLGGLPAHPQNPHYWRISLTLLDCPLSYGLDKKLDFKEYAALLENT